MRTVPDGYEEKFASFIELCGTAKGQGAEAVVVANAGVLGDNYAELIESLNRLAESGLALQIAGATK